MPPPDQHRPSGTIPASPPCSLRVARLKHRGLQIDTNRWLAYLLLRLTVGVMFLFFGISKLLKGLGPFVSGMRKRFEQSPLPVELVEPFAYVLPFVEVTVGTLVVLGLFTRVALFAAGLLMLALTFGAVMEPSPPTVANNINYALVIFVLLWLVEFNRYSVDHHTFRNQEES